VGVKNEGRSLRAAIEHAQARGGGQIYRESAVERVYTVPAEGKIRNPEGFLPSWTQAEIYASDWKVR
jgi:hypothetical protein